VRHGYSRKRCPYTYNARASLTAEIAVPLPIQCIFNINNIINIFIQNINYILHYCNIMYSIYISTSIYKFCEILRRILYFYLTSY